METQAAQTAEAFFLEHAGYSYDPKTETAEQGRARCAKRLAEAEREGTDRGWTVGFREDSDADRSWLDQDGYSESDRANASFVSCCLYDEDGNVLDSIHAIHEDARMRQEARDYRRVVRAELMDEALSALPAREEA